MPQLKNFRLFGLFAGLVFVTFLMTAGGGIAVSALGSFGKTEPPVSPAPFPRLADSLQVELNAALAPEPPFNLEGVGNPFAAPDRFPGFFRREFAAPAADAARADAELRAEQSAARAAPAAADPDSDSGH